MAEATMGSLSIVILAPICDDHSCFAQKLPGLPPVSRFRVPLFRARPASGTTKEELVGRKRVFSMQPGGGYRQLDLQRRLPTRQGRITGRFQIEGHQDKQSNAEACGFSIVMAPWHFVQQSYVFIELLFLCLLY